MSESKTKERMGNELLNYLHNAKWNSGKPCKNPVIMSKFWSSQCVGFGDIIKHHCPTDEGLDLFKKISNDENHFYESSATNIPLFAWNRKYKLLEK